MNPGMLILFHEKHWVRFRRRNLGSVRPLILLSNPLSRSSFLIVFSRLFVAWESGDGCSPLLAASQSEKWNCCGKSTNSQNSESRSTIGRAGLEEDKQICRDRNNMHWCSFRKITVGFLKYPLGSDKNRDMDSVKITTRVQWPNQQYPD